MQKIILITGATDGIGLETAKMLVADGHHVIVHGRNEAKLQNVEQGLIEMNAGKVESIVADLSSVKAVKQMVAEVAERFGKLDVIINNAGVFATPNSRTQEGLDVRFAVNTIAPYMLTKELLPLLGNTGRVVNLSSAAQAPVSIEALMGEKPLSDGEAYAQSKLALTMCSRVMGLQLKNVGPMVVSINPKSFLGSKMVKDAYGIAGNDISLGADILIRAALSDEFAQAHGSYFDNDIEAFAAPHRDALNDIKSQQVVEAIEAVIAKLV
ncbi:SDR family NAD(P)-dependent oxidoreductase [Vibrio jasicida]|uniref:SDR family NAD(P)-dependent oxidoreductase n=1 Tax=Vibrio jasicida TaxID=766224 RepID=UPI0003A6F37D|nr:SDR family NAD(P)-dependent oxidoreductase [Vibrio jasicida]